MNRLLNLCSWVCIAAVSYMYGYERGTNEIIIDIVEWVVSGDAGKALANLADSIGEDIPKGNDEVKANVNTKTLN